MGKDDAYHTTQLPVKVLLLDYYTERLKYKLHVTEAQLDLFEKSPCIRQGRYTYIYRTISNKKKVPQLLKYMKAQTD